MLGYGVGLSLAFVASVLRITINGVQGPALRSYTLPCTLIPLLVLGHSEDFGKLWNGFQVDFAAVAAEGSLLIVTCWKMV